MEERFAQARGAVRIYATAGCFAGFAHNVSVADRALLRHAERAALLALLDHFDDLRNYVAAAFYENGVADFYAQARDLVFVVQSGARHGYACQRHWLQMSYR